MLPELPATAAWHHVGGRIGFEVVFLRRERGGYRVDGHSTAVEHGEAWGIRYALVVDSGWVTRCAAVAGRSAAGEHEVRLDADGTGGWRIDGRPAPALDGCLDVDLEVSAFTNALPVRRLRLEVGQRADAPAAYVRAPRLDVQRLEQRYARLESDAERSRYDYAAPGFGFACVIVYDERGLALDYPGIAVRVA